MGKSGPHVLPRKGVLAKTQPTVEAPSGPEQVNKPCGEQEMGHQVEGPE